MASGTWTAVATTGNWNLANTTPWLSSIVADGVDSTATFSSNITAITTVTSTESRTIGNLTFSDNGASGSAWVLASSSGTFTLDVATGSPTITTTTAATVSLALNGTDGFTKAGAQGLTLSGDLSGLSGNVAVSAGTLTLTPPVPYTLSGNITGAGTITKSAGTSLVTLTGSTISVATLNAGTGGIAFSTATTQAVSSATSGTISKIGAGETTVSGNGGGTWTVAEGTVKTTVPMSGGTWTIQGGATVTATAENQKTFIVSSGGFLNLLGQTSQTAASAVIQVNGTAVLEQTRNQAVTAGAGGVVYWQGSGASNDGLNGTFAFDGTLSNIATAIVQTGFTLDISNGIGGYSAFNLGSAANTAGRLFVKDGTVRNYASLSAGGSAAGATPSYGYVRQTAGFLGNSGTGASTSTIIGGYSYGVMDVLGGTNATGTIAAGRAVDTAISSVNFLGGTSSTGALTFGLGTAAAAIPNRYGVVTVDGVSLTATTVNFGPTLTAARDTGTAVINVRNAATLVSQTMTRGDAASGVSRINVDNGTLSSLATGTWAGGSIYFWSGGGFVNVAPSAATSVNMPIVDPTGNGLNSQTALNIISAGAGYTGAPAVVITGGGGIGATARAEVDLTEGSPTLGQVTAVFITNPGTGYTSIPIVTLYGGGTSSPASITAFAPTPNSVATAWTKANSGQLLLAATNTFTALINVTAGTLSIGNAAASGTIGLSDASPVAIGTGSTLNFNRNDSPTYSNLLSGLGGISKTSGATPTFTTLSTANTFTGAVTVTSGALRATHADAVGTGSGSVTVASGASFEIAGGINLNSNRGATIAGTGLGGLGALRNVLGDNTIAGPIALSAAATIGSDAGTLTLSSTATTSLAGNALSLIGAGNIDLSPVFSGTATVTKTSGTGVAILRGSSTYTGKTTVTAGTIGYRTTAGSGVASSLGAPTLAASLIVDVAGGATVGASAGLRFVGTVDQTFSRVINVTGTNAAGLTVRIEASSNTAKVTHSTAITNTTLNQPRTYQFGGTGTADNTVSFIIANNGSTTNTVSVVKADAGKWLHTNNNTYTGTLAVNAGTLTLSGTNTPSSVAVSNVGTVLVASSPTGAARFGTTTVTVNASAKIQTLTGSGQTGRHTYNNLTFAAGGRIRIGG